MYHTPLGPSTPARPARPAPDLVSGCMHWTNRHLGGIINPAWVQNLYTPEWYDDA